MGINGDQWGLIVKFRRILLMVPGGLILSVIKIGGYY